MDSILQGLNDLEGVHGTLVADPSGQVLAYKAHAVYDLTLLQQVSRTVVSAIDSVKLLHEDWESVTTHFSEGKLLIRNLGAGKTKGPALTLTVIADARLNPSFAGVAIRVAVSKIRALLDGTASASAPMGASNPFSASHPMPPVATSSPVMNVQPAAPPVPMTSSAPKQEVATSGLSWSGFGSSSSMSGSGVAVADPASSALLTLCTKALARSVGPMAKLFVKESVRRICPDRPFSRANAQALIAELEKNIEDPAEIAQFRQTVLKSL